MSFLIILCVIVFLLLSPSCYRHIKGRRAELKVHRILSWLTNEYYSLEDITLEHNGYTTQIDHIVISPYGIFIIETKGYHGWILGGEKNEYWTQCIYGNKYKFYNPILQNQGHLRYLMRLLKNVNPDYFIPIVTFNDNATIKVPHYKSIVINHSQLKQVILQYNNRVFSKQDIDNIISTIQSAAVTNKKVKKQHKTNVEKARVYRNYNLINGGKCPECGGVLVERSGKYGNFYGCSNYPKCRHTEK